MTDKDCTNSRGDEIRETDRRFDRVLRMFGHDGMRRLENAHVMIIGVGGVGSWAAEAVTRSGVGRVTVVDGDYVCIRNFNRQLQAVDGVVGKLKADVLAQRLRLINPSAEIVSVPRYFTQDNADEMLTPRPDFLIDAIDHVTSKCFLIDYCRRSGIPFISSTGSGGRVDPTQVRVVDLGLTQIDPLARALRQILRSKYGYHRKGKFGVNTVCSTEIPLEPQDADGVSSCKNGCLCPNGENEFQSCTKKGVVLGTVMFATAAFGMVCASSAVRHIAAGGTEPENPAEKEGDNDKSV